MKKATVISDNTFHIFIRLRSLIFKPPFRRRVKWFLNSPTKISFFFSSIIWSFIYLLDIKNTKIEELLYKKSLYKLRGLQSDEKTIDDVLYTQDNYSGLSPFTSIRAHQIQSEIIDLLRELRNLEPEIVTEIGTAEGGSLYIWARCLSKCKTLISVDLPGRIPHNKKRFFQNFNNDIEFIFFEGDSHNQKMVDDITEILGSRRIDFLFIDGDHSYEGVKRDFMNFRNLMSENGIIGLHDIKAQSLGVMRFWNEIKNQYKHREIMDDDLEIPAGIGIIYV